MISGLLTVRGDGKVGGADTPRSNHQIGQVHVENERNSRVGFQPE